MSKELEIKLFKQKSYNLRNLYQIDKQKFSVFLGNRDLNKVKYVLLNKLKEQESDQRQNIINFNNGVDNLTPITILTDLTSKLNGTQFKSLYDKFPETKENNETHLNFWKEDYRNWGPFWRDYIKKDDAYIIDDNKFKGYSGPGNGGANFNERDPVSFYERFKIIFGSDPKDGTMSASNLLYTIPLELKIINSTTLNLLIDSFILNKNDFIKNNILLLNYLAYIVLLTFNKLLNISLDQDTTKDKLSPYKSLLWKIYEKNNLINIKKYINYYYFSHGGIINLDIICILYYKIMADNQIHDLLINHDATPINYDNITINDNVKTKTYTHDDYNILFHNCINYIKSTTNINEVYRKYMLYLIINSSNCNIKDYISIDKKYVPLNIFGNLEMNKDNIYKVSLESTETIYQFVGHQSYGMTSTIKKIEGSNCYIIDLDNSLTWRFYFNEKTTNYAYIYRNGIISIKVNISINNIINESTKLQFSEGDLSIYNIFDYVNSITINNIFDLNENKYDGKPKYIKYSSYHLYIIKSSNINFKDILNKNIEFKINTNNHIFEELNLNFNPDIKFYFHFIFKNRDIYYITFTIALAKFNTGQPPQFGKVIYILSFNDFKSFILTNTKNIINDFTNLKDIILISKLFDHTISSFKKCRSKPKSLVFKNKYLKYKNKYLQLKDPKNYNPITEIRDDFTEDKVIKYKLKYLELKNYLSNI